ncbi:VOC family protein [Sphingobacterium sp. LRF_L2]|uniref:VOC family protein n=1 Tax=Sphingobacterium sp. LRF_L2 TaxID=3369421 RepID=UPI003F5D78D5
MANENKIQLSHVLYRVQDLHQSVKKLQEAGFTVQYGTAPEKAYNALIWFESGVFIEIYKNSGLPAPIKWFMKTFGYQPILDRMDKWDQIDNNWCEWSLESTMTQLDTQKALFKEKNVPFKFHKAKRKDINGQTLRWELLMPNDIIFPFIMSAYAPNPRPKYIRHANGISGVSSLVVGKENLNTELLYQLLPNNGELRLIDGKSGLQEVELSDSSINIRDILRS